MKEPEQTNDCKRAHLKTITFHPFLDSLGCETIQGREDFFACQAVSKLLEKLILQCLAGM